MATSHLWRHVEVKHPNIYKETNKGKTESRKRGHGQEKPKVVSERCFSKASILYRNTLRNGLSKELAADLVAIQTGLADKILKQAVGNWEIEDDSEDVDNEDDFWICFNVDLF